MGALQQPLGLHVHQVGADGLIGHAELAGEGGRAYAAALLQDAEDIGASLLGNIHGEKGESGVEGGGKVLQLTDEETGGLAEHGGDILVHPAAAGAELLDELLDNLYAAAG